MISLKILIYTNKAEWKKINAVVLFVLENLFFEGDPSGFMAVSYRLPNKLITPETLDGNDILLSE